MNRKEFLIIACLAACCLLALHLLALEFFFYWRLWWFDWLVHIVGGIVVGLIAGLFVLFPKARIKTIFLTVVGTALCVSLLWELFEYNFGLTFVSNNYLFDTVSDIVAGFIGGEIAANGIVRFFKEKVA